MAHRLTLLVTFANVSLSGVWYAVSLRRQPESTGHCADVAKTDTRNFQGVSHQVGYELKVKRSVASHG